MQLYISSKMVKVY